MKKFIAVLAFVFAMPSLVWAQDNIVSTAASAGPFDTLVSLLVATGLDETLEKEGDFTVFAPTDEAFAKLPAETLAELRKPENRDQLVAILKYHVIDRELSVAEKRPSHPITSAKTLQGSRISFKRIGKQGAQLTVNDKRVTQRNLRCSNGLIQVIDGVLLPPEDKSIVAVAAKADSFNTLLAAARAAGLAETLAGEGPFTVFAPTDEAFAAIKSDVAELLKPENKDQLAAILKLHVVPGKVTARQAVQAGQAKTLEGSRVEIEIRDGKLVINDASVIKNDIMADNGIIHVIDRVLLPTNNQADTHTSNPQTLKIRADWRNSIRRSNITTGKLIIEVAGGGSVDLSNVTADEIETRIAGGGSVRISGRTDRHEVTVNGGASLSAFDLQTSDTRIQVRGGGVADINATEILDVSANSGAKVRYVETDAKITKRINKYASFTPFTP